MADHEMGEDQMEPPPEEELVNAIAGHFAGSAAGVRRNGRLVNLLRDDNGGYQIIMRGRVIQGFCSEFEDITAWSQPRDTQIQARITIVPTGRLRSARYPEMQGRVEPAGYDPESVQRRLAPDEIGAVPTGNDGVRLESRAHPVHWQEEALRHLRMERDQMAHTIDMIESLGRR